LIGYYYLPGRDSADGDFNSKGLGGWFSRTKIGGPYRKAPIMSDQLTELSTGWTCAAEASGRQYPISNHVDKNLVPEGGNFLYEDGHVEWLNFKWGGSLGVAAPGSQVKCGYLPSGMSFYLWPTELDKGPW
jgi:hypothetical protein